MYLRLAGGKEEDDGKGKKKRNTRWELHVSWIIERLSIIHAGIYRGKA